METGLRRKSSKNEDWDKKQHDADKRKKRLARRGLRTKVCSRTVETVPPSPFVPNSSAPTHSRYYDGYWLLGRKISLSPFEVAEALHYSTTVDERTGTRVPYSVLDIDYGERPDWAPQSSSNVSADELVKILRSRKVRCGEVAPNILELDWAWLSIPTQPRREDYTIDFQGWTWCAQFAYAEYFQKTKFARLSVGRRVSLSGLGSRRRKRAYAETACMEPIVDECVMIHGRRWHVKPRPVILLAASASEIRPANSALRCTTTEKKRCIVLIMQHGRWTRSRDSPTSRRYSNMSFHPGSHWHAYLTFLRCLSLAFTVMTTSLSFIMCDGKTMVHNGSTSTRRPLHPARQHLPVPVLAHAVPLAADLPRPRAHRVAVVHAVGADHELDGHLGHRFVRLSSACHLALHVPQLGSSVGHAPVRELVLADVQDLDRGVARNAEDDY
ncbi:hypothetical protein FOPE_10444 [Fonsecaea pedrosoi]|nr:hypothetical protein FOPE_10444 [Fonsecaea pedrosoi]